MCFMSIQVLRSKTHHHIKLRSAKWPSMAILTAAPSYQDRARSPGIRKILWCSALAIQTWIEHDSINHQPNNQSNIKRITEKISPSQTERTDVNCWSLSHIWIPIHQIPRKSMSYATIHQISYENSSLSHHPIGTWQNSAPLPQQTPTSGARLEPHQHRRPGGTARWIAGRPLGPVTITVTLAPPTWS